MGKGSSKPEINKQLYLNLQNQQILLISELGLSLTIGQLEVFPHGLDGLKLWDAGIVLSRYIIINCHIFKDKDVLELGTGVGISGICCKKWTQCKSITITDYNLNVVNNALKNCTKNQVTGIETLVFDWRNRKSNKQSYDIICGSDIVYFGCPVKDLYQVFKSYLRVGGLGIIVIPDRKNYAELFLKEMEPEYFTHEIEHLSDPRYIEPVLKDKLISEKQYSLLKDVKFFVYKITKIK